MSIRLFDSFYDQEYLCGIVTGNHRKGKTLLLAFFGVKYADCYNKVYANFYLDVPNFEKLDTFDKHTLSGLKPGSLVLATELHHYTDCRKSMYEDQIDLTQSLQEIGKIGGHFIGDIKRADMLDIRMRDLFNFSIYAFGKRNRLGERYKDIYKYALYQDQSLRFEMDYPEVYFYLDGLPVYPRYNTKEFIAQSEKIENKEKEIIKTLADF